MTENSKAIRSVDRLLKIMDRLRSPGGCPWDAAQTPETLKPYLLEETYEVLEAIDQGDTSSILDELGDLLLQVVFLARIFEERGAFDFGDIAAAIADKMVRRHPHVFDDLKIRDPESLDILWDQIKGREKKARGEKTMELGDIPRTLPSLLRAKKLAEKASRRGEIPIPTVRETLTVYEKAGRSGDVKWRTEAFGDLLFAMANMGRLMDIDAEEALRMTLNRYARSFDKSERSPEE